MKLLNTGKWNTYDELKNLYLKTFLRRDVCILFDEFYFAVVSAL